MRFSLALTAVMVAVAVAACGSGDPSGGRLSGGVSTTGCTGAQKSVLSTLEDRLPAGSSITGLVDHPATLALPMPTSHVDVVTAKVTLHLPELPASDLRPVWVWAKGKLYNGQGDADVATATLPGLPYAGGRLPADVQAAQRCLELDLAAHPSHYVTKDVTSSVGTLRLSGAVQATVTGPCHASCARSSAPSPLRPDASSSCR